VSLISISELIAKYAKQLQEEYEEMNKQLSSDLPTILVEFFHL